MREPIHSFLNDPFVRTNERVRHEGVHFGITFGLSLSPAFGSVHWDRQVSRTDPSVLAPVLWELQVRDVEGQRTHKLAVELIQICLLDAGVSEIKLGDIRVLLVLVLDDC